MKYFLQNCFNGRWLGQEKREKLLFDQFESLQVVALQRSVPTNTSNVNDLDLQKRSSRIRLFDETEVPKASNGTDQGMRLVNMQADVRETTTKTSANVITSPTSVGMQADGTPSSQNVGSNQPIGWESNETGNSRDPDSNGNDQVNVKRKRGFTRNIALSNVKKAGQKVHVNVLDMSGRLIGEGAQRYISEASCVIRKYGKWKAPKWSRLSKEEREQMLKITNNSFMYDEGAHVKQALVKQLNSQYRSQRYNFHTIFKTFRTKEEALANRPQYVEEFDWICLCDYFYSPEFKRKMKEIQLETQTSGASRTEEDICVEVIGRVTGYVRGRGPSKASLIAQKLVEIEEFKKRAEQAEKRSAELEIQVQSQQQLMQRLELQEIEMQNQQVEMQDLLKALRSELLSKKQGNGSSSDNLCWFAFGIRSLCRLALHGIR